MKAQKSKSEKTTIAVSPEFRDKLRDNIPKSKTYEQFLIENLEFSEEIYE